MKQIIFLALTALSAIAGAQVTNRIEYVAPYQATTERLRLDCEQAQVGRGLGQCTDRTVLHVMNAPAHIKAAVYDCATTWELEKDQGKLDYLELTKKVTVRLTGGHGREVFENSTYVGKATDPVKRIVRSSSTCYSLSF